MSYWYNNFFWAKLFEVYFIIRLLKNWLNLILTLANVDILQSKIELTLWTEEDVKNWNTKIKSYVPTRLLLILQKNFSIICLRWIWSLFIILFQCFLDNGYSSEPNDKICNHWLKTYCTHFMYLRNGSSCQDKWWCEMCPELPKPPCSNLSYKTKLIT